MRPSVTVPNLLLMAVLLFSGMNCFRICSYNIPEFNSAKSSNYRVIHILTKVLCRCDISLLLDVQDPVAVKTLLASLNRYSEKYKYNYVCSKPLGRDPDNMQSYCFIHRLNTSAVIEQYQYQSLDFARPPFPVHFHCNKTLVQDFVLVPLHTDQKKTVQELNKLYDVFLEIVKKWNKTNVMFLGDFHAGCAYMTRADKKKIRLFSNTSFSWLITDRVDTTVTDETHCPYDRIVVYGKQFLKQIKPFSAKVFNPIQSLKIRSSQLMDVSNHFPVEVELKSSVTSTLRVSPLYFLLLILHFLYLTS